MFQSTHPRRVRQMIVFCLIYTQSFNPRTHVGCDESRSCLLSWCIGFNPRTHVGCDFHVANVRTAAGSFNPRTHVGCDS